MKLAVIAASAVLWISAQPAAAQEVPANYPDKPMEIFLHAGPGSSMDLMVRTAVSILEKNKIVPATFIVQNKTGANGGNAIAYGNRKAGDPYSLWVISSTFVTTKERGLPEANFTPVALLETEYQQLTVRAESPYKTLEEFIEAAKKEPGVLSVGIGRNANPDHQAAYQLEQAAGVTFNTVTLGGGAQTVTSLLAGDTDFSLGDYNESEGHLKAGTLRVLAVASPVRNPLLPDVPTFTEKGYDVVQSTPRGIGLPGKASPETVRFWEDKFEAMSNTQEWGDYLAKSGKVQTFARSAGFAEVLDKLAKREGPIITTLNGGQ